MRNKIPPNLFHLLSASFDQTAASPPARCSLSQWELDATPFPVRARGYTVHAAL